MARESVTPLLLGGGVGLNDRLPKIIREMSGLTVSVVAGAAANTKMDLAAIREEDTILAAVVNTDAGGASVDDKANITIQSCKATGTVTFATAINGNTFAVNGVTYTVRTAALAVSATDIRLTVNADGTGGNRTDAQMATAAAKAVNDYESRYIGGLGWAGASGYNEPAVYATSTGASGVVTFTAIKEGAGNGPVVTGTATVLVAAGSGTASATLTPASVVEDNTCVVNGVTFTAKAAPASDVEFDVSDTDVHQGAEIARCINYYESVNGTLDVTASASATTGVVTITPKSAKQGNIIPLAGTVTKLAASGAALAGGTATGGLKSTSTLTGKELIVVWLNKNP